MKRLMAIIFTVTSAAAFTPGCGRSESRYSPVDPTGWNGADAVTVCISNTDTLSLRNMDIFVAYDPANTECGEVTFEITVTTPDSLRFTDTLGLRLPDSGATAGNAMHTATAAYRHDARLLREGEYIFTIRHTSPQPLRGIRGVGIETSETQRNGER